ncbi:MAG: MiaB/RimO family radical SAM methylthiotransferase [Fretibacterium sp.]|nr:MiaB/RimO family radical SAM methylthiotransferase [Fretibacterium sp.]
MTGEGAGQQAPAGLAGARVWLRVFGCRSNLCEAEFLAAELEARGACVTQCPQELDSCQAAVVLTCSVTGTADRKCRQTLRRARRALGRNGVLVACGCWAQAVTAEEAQELGVDLLVGNRRKVSLADALQSLLAHGRAFVELRADLTRDREWEKLSLPGARPRLHTRAFLKVQEGCDHFCSYCVIPFLRGRSTSCPLCDVLDEVKGILDAGCREVVLTGIHLGVYGRERGSSLVELIRALSALPGLARLRLGSLEPFALTDELLDALAESPVFCPHLHLPLQSGDDGVLERMRRGYKGEDFVRLCERARGRLGDELHISTDVLVAFPGEGEEAFENTLAVMHRAGLGRAHVFPYSPRPLTAAAGFGGRVPRVVASERVARASALGEQLLSRYAACFVGRVLPVLAEECEKDSFKGYTPHFIQTVVLGGAEPGEILKTRVASEERGELRACLV